MHQDVTKMCQIFKKPHTYTNASPRLHRLPKISHLFPRGERGAGLGSWCHHSGYPHRWVWPSNGLQVMDLGRTGLSPGHAGPPPQLAAFEGTGAERALPGHPETTSWYR